MIISTIMADIWLHVFYIDLSNNQDAKKIGIDYISVFFYN